MALVAVCAFLVGMGVGYDNLSAEKKVVELENKEKPLNVKADFSPFWEVWNLVNDKYVDGNIAVENSTTSIPKKPLTDQEKVWGAIGGLVKSLNDPYTVFLPPKESGFFQDDMNGSFEGVGMEVGLKNDIITVVAPLEGSPAKRAGIKAGDKVFAIDSAPTVGLSVEEAVLKIRGKRGTQVALTILRENVSEPIEIKITRATIEIPTIQLGDTKSGNGKTVAGNNSGNGLRDDGIFVIRLFNFSAKSSSLFRDALRKFVESNSDMLLLDLRGNPGGYLEAAVDMASWFLPQGKVIVTEAYGKNGPDKVHRSKGYDIFNKNLKFVILVDGGSASASEILAGALMEHGVAKLVGEKTFGKGSVQELVQMGDGASLKITVAKWLTPNGHSISDNGLVPNIVVPFTPKDIEAKKDPQMDRAVKLLLDWK